MEPTRVLICEDEHIIAFELEKRLKNFGHEVVGVVSNGPDALHQVGLQRPDIALMDINLAGEMSGIDVATVLRTDFEIPSIYLTAFSDPETVNEAKKADPVGYLLKPVQDRDLRTAIEIGMSVERQRTALRREIQSYREQLQQSLPGSAAQMRGMSREEARADAIAQVSGGVAHYVNNALLVVAGNLEWLCNNTMIRKYEMRHIQEALAGCDQARQVLDRLLWSSSGGLYDLNFVNVGELVGDIVTCALPVMRRNSIEVQLEIDSGGLFSVIDRRAVREAISGLLSNAREASCQHGDRVIQVAVSRKYFQHPARMNPDATPGPFVVVSITDTGPGISPERMEAVKEPFFTDSRNEHSIGLGLPVANGVAVGHGGWLNIESAVDRGTKVEFVVPGTSD